MPAQKLKDFLDWHNIKYVTISHSLAYTAQEIAASAHIAGKDLAKTVMVKIDDKMAMAVLPASYKVSFDLLKKAAGASKVELANEQEFRDLSIHLVISTWKSIEDWNNWINTPERKAVQQKIDAILEEPTRIAPYKYESFPVNADETLSSLEFGVEGE